MWMFFWRFLCASISCTWPFNVLAKVLCTTFAFVSEASQGLEWPLDAKQVHKADPKAVEDAIRCGGLAETKAKRIVNILDTIYKERGLICLEYVRSMTIDEIKAELSRFKGVGPKTVRMTISCNSWCLLICFLQISPSHNIHSEDMPWISLMESGSALCYYSLSIANIFTYC